MLPENQSVRFTLTFLACSLVLPLTAQTGETAPAPYAQKLVDEAMAKHPDLVILAVHAKSETDPHYPIIAWGGPKGGKVRLGKKADEDDMRVINTGKANLEVNATGNHFEVELPLQDVNKKTIGALGVVYNYKPGDDKEAMRVKAVQVRDELRDQTPSAERLLGKP